MRVLWDITVCGLSGLRFSISGQRKNPKKKEKKTDQATKLARQMEIHQSQAHPVHVI